MTREEAFFSLENQEKKSFALRASSIIIAYFCVLLRTMFINSILFIVLDPYECI